MLKPTTLESPNWSFTSFYRGLEEKRLCAKVHMIHITSFLFHKNWFIFEVSNVIFKNLALCRMMRLMNARQALCRQAKLPAPNSSNAVKGLLLSNHLPQPISSQLFLCHGSSVGEAAVGVTVATEISCPEDWL